MNLIVLMLTYTLRGCQVTHRRLRMLLASLCGALIMALLVLFAPGYGWMALGTALLAVPFMLFVAFGWNGRKDFFLRVLLSLFAIVVSNGVAEALQNLIGIRVLTLYVLILVIPAARALVKLAQNALERQARMYTVQLGHGENRVECLALYDSGNLLTTADGEPVHIASPALLDGLELGEESAFELIPFQALGTGQGWIRIVKVDCVKIKNGKSERNLSDIWLGKAEESLFRGKSYQMILNGAKGVLP